MMILRSKSAGRKLGAANLVGRRRVHTVIYGCKMINSASFVTVQGRYCRRVWIEQTKGGGQEWIVRGPLWHCFSSLPRRKDRYVKSTVPLKYNGQGHLHMLQHMRGKSKGGRCPKTSPRLPTCPFLVTNESRDDCQPGNGRRRDTDQKRLTTKLRVGMVAYS
jgi:hypothetical protein